MKITIIGSGNMAQGIGSRLANTNHDLAIYDRSIEEAQKLAGQLGHNASAYNIDDQWQGEIIILALPYPAIFELLAKHSSELGNKIVVDISNPVNFDTFQLIPSPGVAGAEEIAKQIPEAKVIKAFNTVFAGVLKQGKIKDEIIDVFVAGDDQQAKDQIKQVINESGMRPIDAGQLSNARHLEGFMLIHMTAQEQLQSNWMSAIKLLS